MPLPSSGPLSLNDIQGEFGGTNPIGMNEYYAGGGLVPAGTTGTFGAVPSSGALSVQNFYGTSNVIPVYIEDVFSTWLISGTGSAQTITNGIDLAGKGGLVWTKTRNQAFNHALYDTARGSLQRLISNSAAASGTRANSVTAFNSDGFSVGTDISASGDTYASWTFREQPKFFDVVTYTGNGVNGRQIAHNLESVPGCMIIKATSAANPWAVYHRSYGATGGGNLNNIDAFSGSSDWFNNTAPTSTVFSLGTSTNTNGSGTTYVAYLFAHNAGGFGPSGTDNVISCGSYTGNNTSGNTITLGYEPQWLMVKRIDNNTGDWFILDNMRGIASGGTDATLYANTTGAEINNTNWIDLTATGFVVASASNTLNATGSTYIYIAIRRGPMKTPTTGTSVFTPYLVPASPTTGAITGFVTDAGFIGSRAGSDKFAWGARLMGNPTLNSTNTNAESANSNQIWDRMNGWWNTAINNYMTWGFARAPGYMDVVCYTGTGSSLTLNHNLTVTPELVISKRRSGAYDWTVYSSARGTSNTLFLNLTNAETAYTSVSAATSTTFTVEGVASASGETFVAYLFASCPGVSKVGSFTGTGATQVINCGFTTGARFVLIKATSTTGGWLIWDSARGIVAGNDPYLALNSTAAEVTTTDWVDTAASGFELSNAGGNLANSNGVSYIFLAIA